MIGIDYAKIHQEARAGRPDFEAPVELEHDDIIARALTRADLDDDVRGINVSLELIRRTRGGGWPTEAVSPEFNFVDLVWHEQEFREHTSFAYSVWDRSGSYLGCAYLYPMGQRTELSPELLSYDVDVSWWVTPDAYERGYYQKLHTALSTLGGRGVPVHRALLLQYGVARRLIGLRRRVG